MDEQELLKRLQEAFKIESEERLLSMSTSLTELEKVDDFSSQKPIIEIIFREAHSLKGAARAVNLVDIEKLFQSAESLFGKLKNQDLEVSSDIFDILHDCVKLVNNILANSDIDYSVELTNLTENLDKLDNGEQLEVQSEEVIEISDVPDIPTIPEIPTIDDIPTIPTIDDIPVIPEIPKKVAQVAKPTKVAQVAKPTEVAQVAKPTEVAQVAKPTEVAQVAKNVRVSIEKLDELLLKSEELISLKLISVEYSKNLKHSILSVEDMQKEHLRIKSDIEKIEKYLLECNDDNFISKKIIPLVRFIKQEEQDLKKIVKGFQELSMQGEHNTRILSKMVDDFLDNVKQISMFPFSTLLDLFPIMIRDIAKSQGKKISLNITGNEIEIDKRILENIKDPLVHILRNSADHGICSPEKRLALGKPERGDININIERKQGNFIEIRISDNGKGIDREELKKIALKKEIMSQLDIDKLDDEQALDLIFHSGFSTTDMVTDLSGRGLGCAIVRDNIEKLGGSVVVETELGEGTNFVIKLPVTLATYRGVLVRIKDDIFVLPSSQVEQVTRINKADINFVEDKEMVHLGEKIVPLTHLGDILKLENYKSSLNDNEVFSAVLLGSNNMTVAFEVDEVLGEQDVLVKDLGPQLEYVNNISGATILGSGRVVPILNVQDLLSNARGVKAIQQTTISDDNKEEKKKILVVDDSITSRMLLKSVLESSGYTIYTAFDGADAYAFLKSNDVELVVTDIEMPRMTGFELTAKIKNDSSISHLPVILVSSLATQEDQERGVDVGANAYIIKSNFNQSNLVEAIERFI